MANLGRDHLTANLLQSTVHRWKNSSTRWVPGTKIRKSLSTNPQCSNNIYFILVLYKLIYLLICWQPEQNSGTVDKTDVVMCQCEVAQYVRAVVTGWLWHAAETEMFKVCCVVNVRPVLMTFDSTALDVSGQHHNQRWTLLPDHLPEVQRRLRQWPLGRYVTIDDPRPWNLHLRNTDTRRKM